MTHRSWRPGKAKAVSLLTKALTLKPRGVPGGMSHSACVRNLSMGSRLEGHLILPTFPLAFDLHIRLEFYEAGSHALRVLAWTSLPPTPPNSPGPGFGCRRPGGRREARGSEAGWGQSAGPRTSARGRGAAAGGRSRGLGSRLGLERSRAPAPARSPAKAQAPPGGVRPALWSRPRAPAR